MLVDKLYSIAALVAVAAAPAATDDPTMNPAVSLDSAMTRTIPPSCVLALQSQEKRGGFRGTVWHMRVRNTCRDTQRVASARRFWFDGDCHVLLPGQTYYDSDERYAFQGVNAC